MKTIIHTALFLILFFSGAYVYAWGGGYYHGHGGWGGGYYHGHDSWGGGYWGPGYYPGWGGPNVIINVPIVPSAPRAPYYARQCDTVQVCNEYNECWLEKECY